MLSLHGHMRLLPLQALPVACWDLLDVVVPGCNVHDAQAVRKARCASSSFWHERLWLILHLAQLLHCLPGIAYAME